MYESMASGSSLILIANMCGRNIMVSYVNSHMPRSYSQQKIKGHLHIHQISDTLLQVAHCDYSELPSMSNMESSTVAGIRTSDVHVVPHLE